MTRQTLIGVACVCVLGLSVPGACRAQDLATSTETFHASVADYLWCSLGGDINLTQAGSSWTGTTSLTTRANRAFELKTGWGSYTGTGTATVSFSLDGGTSWLTDATFGDHTSGFLSAGKRQQTGTVSVEILEGTPSATPSDPGIGLTSAQAGVIQDNSAIGTVVVTLFAF